MTEDATLVEHVSIAPTRAGTRGRLLNLLMRSYFKRKAGRLTFTDGEIAATRHRLERLSARGMRRDEQVQIRQARIAGIPVEVVEPHQDQAERPVILYMHGGAFLAGSPRTHRGITRYLARAIGARVVVPDYRLAPEHVFPTALGDVIAVYRALLDGAPASRIGFVGDSAGGNLVLSALLEARAHALPLPAAAMAISPWADLTGSGDSVNVFAKKDAMLPAHKLAATAHIYAGHVDLRLPTVSPIFGDYAGLPPLLVHVGTTEILQDDARGVVERAREAGVDAQLRMWRSLPHVFHAFADYLPAARTALQEIADFMTVHVGDAAPLAAAVRADRAQ